MCTLNVLKDNNDNGNGKNWLVFLSTAFCAKMRCARAQNAAEIKKAPNRFPSPLSTLIFETFGLPMSLRVPNPSLDSTTVTNLPRPHRHAKRS